MSSPPLVSILTPTYNGARFLEGCLTSVLEQDYPHIEHIVQDGASTDDTAAILERYQGRIDAVSEPDEGQAHALDTALKRSRGEILLVLNADDELLPHACSWGVRQLAEHPDCAAVYGEQVYIDETGAICRPTPVRDPYDFARVLCSEDSPPAQAMFIRRASLEAVGFHVDRSLKSLPDFEWLVRLGMKFPLAHVPDVVCQYREHGGSETARGDFVDTMVQARLTILDKHLRAPGTPPEVARLERRAISGALHWGARVSLKNGRVGDAATYLVRSLMMYPAPSRLGDVLRRAVRHRRGTRP